MGNALTDLIFKFLLSKAEADATRSGAASFNNAKSEIRLTVLELFSAQARKQQ